MFIYIAIVRVTAIKPHETQDPTLRRKEGNRLKLARLYSCDVIDLFALVCIVLSDRVGPV